MNIHIINGPNGMCMCGTNGKTCAEIIAEQAPAPKERQEREDFLCQLAEKYMQKVCGKYVPEIYEALYGLGSELSAACQSEVEGWRPIASAPKDRKIDLWLGDRRWIDCYWDTICQEWRTTAMSGHLLTIKPEHVKGWRESSLQPTP